MKHPLHKGRGLHAYPVSQAELEARKEREKALAEARANASTVEVDGQSFVLVRLPDCYGQDIPFKEVSEEWQS